MTLESRREDGGVLTVWHENVVDAFTLLGELIDAHPVVVFAVVWPGTPAVPRGDFDSFDEYQLQVLRCALSLCQPIQVTMRLFDHDGNAPVDAPHTFVFNLHFSTEHDCFTDAVVKELSARIDFARHEAAGIPYDEFGAHLIGSGVVCVPDRTYIAFNGAYDYGMLMRCVLRGPIDADVDKLLPLLHHFFERMFDLRAMWLGRPDFVAETDVQCLNNQVMMAQRLGVSVDPTHIAGVGADAVRVLADMFLVLCKMLPHSEFSAMEGVLLEWRNGEVTAGESPDADVTGGSEADGVVPVMAEHSSKHARRQPSPIVIRSPVELTAPPSDTNTTH